MELITLPLKVYHDYEVDLEKRIKILQDFKERIRLPRITDFYPVNDQLFIEESELNNLKKFVANGHLCLTNWDKLQNNKSESSLKRTWNNLTHEKIPSYTKLTIQDFNLLAEEAEKLLVNLKQQIESCLSVSIDTSVLFSDGDFVTIQKDKLNNLEAKIYQLTNLYNGILAQFTN